MYDLTALAEIWFDLRRPRVSHGTAYIGVECMDDTIVDGYRVQKFRMVVLNA